MANMAISKEQSGKEMRKLQVGNISYITIIKELSGSLATLVPS